MQTIPDAKELLERYDGLKTIRYNWEQIWQEIRELVKPNTSDFVGTRTKGASRNDRIFDDTPTYANSVLSSGIHSYMANPSSRWFEVATNDDNLNRDPYVLAWLESVSNIIYSQFYQADVQHGQMMQELFSDETAFGTGVIFNWWNNEKKQLQFRTYPLANCFIDENDSGVVDTVYRKCIWTTRQARQYFGEKTPVKIIDERNQSKEWEFIYAVFPRSDRDWKNPTARHMPYAAVWLLCDTKEIISESGFKTFPYQVPRWEKMAGEIYGRSPAMNCLQMIRVLNASVKVMLQSSQMQAAPPLLVEDENIVGGIKLQPFSLIYTAPGAENAVRPLQTGANLAVNLDLIKRLQEQIQRCFYNDLFMLPNNSGRDRVTATEIMESRDDRLRQLAPILERQENELFDPQIKRAYSLLLENGMIPEFPSNLRGASLEVNYISPAALAQRGVKAMNMQKFIADLAPLLQVKPDILDVVNFENAIQELALLRNISRSSIRTQEEMQQINAQKQQQAQMAQMAQMAQPVAGAIKDISDASKNNPNIASALSL